eukprot:9163532-Lingulodinium_polyedra.AAC.1
MGPGGPAVARAWGQRAHGGLKRTHQMAPLRSHLSITFCAAGHVRSCQLPSSSSTGCATRS